MREAPCIERSDTAAGTNDRCSVRGCSVRELERHSQLGQDLWVHRHHPQPGLFLDIGAHDGIDLSNTYLLEKLGWRGLCVEADERSYARLHNNRAWTLNKAAWRRTGDVLPFNQHPSEMLSGLGYGDARVETVSINDLCDMVGKVDYVSLDTEGSEVEILKAYDWDRAIPLWTVEHNNNDERISWLVSQFMGHGYLVRMFHWEMVAVRDVG